MSAPRAIMAPGEGRGWRRNWHRATCSLCFGSGGGPGECLRCPRCDGKGEVWARRSHEGCDCPSRVAVGMTVYVRPCGCTGDNFIARRAVAVTADCVEWDEPADIARCSDMVGETNYPRVDVHVAGCKAMANLGGPS